LGKIEGITNALMTSRDKKVTICAIIQSLGNLDVIYGDKTTQVICDNCDYTAVLRVHDVKTQEYFSKRVGTYDKYRFTDTETVSPVLKTKMSIARAETTNNEPIIRPHEFATLRDIILLTQHEAYLGHSGFYRINKAPYYNHEY
jgi:type IV secretory pathway TraG/TraD family ATPase VirD4